MDNVVIVRGLALVKTTTGEMTAENKKGGLTTYKLVKYTTEQFEVSIPLVDGARSCWPENPGLDIERQLHLIWIAELPPWKEPGGRLLVAVEDRAPDQIYVADELHHAFKQRPDAVLRAVELTEKLIFARGDESQREAYGAAVEALKQSVLQPTYPQVNARAFAGERFAFTWRNGTGG